MAASISMSAEEIRSPFSVVVSEKWWHLERAIALAYQVEPKETANIRHEMTHPDAEYFVALYGPRVIGFSGIKKTGTNKHLFEIPWCIVDPEYRGQGLAKRLTRNCIGRAKMLGAQGVQLSTPNANYYAGLGFRVTHTFADEVWGKHLMLLAPL